MKKIILTMITVIAFVLISACNQGILQDQNDNENKKVLGKLNISINEDIMRTIMPVLGTVTQYDISGSGPDSQTFALTNTGTTKETGDLLVGSWTITVTGKDASNNVIVKGTANATVLENQSTPVGVTVNYQQTGKGSVNITIEWDALVSVDSVMFQIDSGSATEIYSSGNSVNYTNANINSGFYKFIFKFKSGVNVISSVTESVHIYDFHNTTKTIDLITTDFKSKPTAPTGLTASEGSGKIVLNWTDTSKVETGFVVERSETSGSDFAAIGGTDTTPLTANTTTYNDTTTANGTTYYYRVLAKNSFGESASGEGSGKLESPGDVTDVTAKASDSQVLLSWTEPTDIDFAKTEIDVSPEISGSPWSLVKGTNSEIITALTNGTTYTFTIKTIDTLGNKSAGFEVIKNLTFYTITFDPNNGDPVSTKTVAHNEVVALPTNHIKLGFEVENWYTEPSYTNQWIFLTDKVTESKTLYAKWNTVTTYEINIDYPVANVYSKIITPFGEYLNGAKTSVNEGMNVTLLVYAPWGYKLYFSKWSDNNTENPRTITNISNNLSLTKDCYAEPLPYRYITFIKNDLEATGTMTDQTIMVGDGGVNLDICKFSKTGYTFKGWATSSTGSIVYTDGANCSSETNITLYAIWE